VPPLAFEGDDAVFVHRSQKIDLGAEVFLGLQAELVGRAIDVVFAGLVDAGTPVVGVLCLARWERALGLGDFLVVLEPEVFFALLEIRELRV
jgi:hypothetical protein